MNCNRNKGKSVLRRTAKPLRHTKNLHQSVPYIKILNWDLESVDPNKIWCLSSCGVNGNVFCSDDKDDNDNEID
jgi:hypothetical protein